MASWLLEAAPGSHTAPTEQVAETWPPRVSITLSRTAARSRPDDDGDFALVAVLEDDAELVAGGAADNVAAAQGARQALAHAHDHFLAGIEAEAVIDHGQPVDGGDDEGAVAAFFLGACRSPGPVRRAGHCG